jgi:type 1 glutamine amidotransferase/sugar phosphate isomerase/epimerase
MKRIWVVLVAIDLTCVAFARPQSGSRGNGDHGNQKPAHAASVAASTRKDVRPEAPSPLPLSLVRLPEWARLHTAVPEILGWTVGVPVAMFPRATFAEAVAEANGANVATVEGNSVIDVSMQVQKRLDYNLAAGEIAAVQDILNAYKIRMPAYSVTDIGPDEQSTRKLFEFAKRLDVKLIICSRVPKDMAIVERFADEYGINVALSGDPDTIAPLLQGRNKRIGVYVDVGKWLNHGENLRSRIEFFQSRIFALRLGDQSALGKKGGPVELGEGIADTSKLLSELYQLGVQPLFFAVGVSHSQNVTTELSRSLDTFDEAVRPIAASRIRQISQTTPTRGPENLTPEERDKIIAAIPQKANGTPEKHRKLLVLDLNVAYGGASGGHHSIPAANLAVEEFGHKTGAFEPILSNDLDNLKYPKIKEFDAIFLNNTVGPIFQDPEVREGLLRFVREGGGLAAYHGASHAGLDWQEFGEMLGTRQGSGRDTDEAATIKIEDSTSPLTAVFNQKEFMHHDEFYRYATGPYSRDNSHVLLSIDVGKTDMNQGKNCMRVCWRADNDYAVAWIRSYGNGRVFFTGLGHNAAFFMDKSLVRFLFDGIQFALGDLDADTTPSASATRPTESGDMVSGNAPVNQPNVQ